VQGSPSGFGGTSATLITVTPGSHREGPSSAVELVVQASSTSSAPSRSETFRRWSRTCSVALRPTVTSISRPVPCRWSRPPKLCNASPVTAWTPAFVLSATAHHPAATRSSADSPGRHPQFQGATVQREAGRSRCRGDEEAGSGQGEQGREFPRRTFIHMSTPSGGDGRGEAVDATAPRSRKRADPSKAQPQVQLSIRIRGSRGRSRGGASTGGTGKRVGGR